MQPASKAIIGFKIFESFLATNQNNQKKDKNFEKLFQVFLGLFIKSIKVRTAASKNTHIT